MGDKIVLIIVEKGVWGLFLQNKNICHPSFFSGLDSFKGSPLEKEMQRHPYVPVFLILDAPEQKFLLDNVSELKLGERFLWRYHKQKRLLKKGCASGCMQLLPGHYLTIVASMEKHVEEWLKYLKNKLLNPVQNIASMPAALTSVWGQIGGSAPWGLIIYGDHKTGYRHSVVLHRHFYCARFLGLDSPFDYTKEIQHTLSFVHHQTGVPEKEIHVVDLTAEKADFFQKFVNRTVIKEDVSLYHLLGYVLAQQSNPYGSLSYKPLSMQLSFQRINKILCVIGFLLLVLSGYYLGRGLIAKEILNQQNQKFLKVIQSISSQS